MHRSRSLQLSGIVQLQRKVFIQEKAKKSRRKENGKILAVFNLSGKTSEQDVAAPTAAPTPLPQRPQQLLGGCRVCRCLECQASIKCCYRSLFFLLLSHLGHCVHLAYYARCSNSAVAWARAELNKNNNNNKQEKRKRRENRARKCLIEMNFKWAAADDRPLPKPQRLKVALTSLSSLHSVSQAAAVRLRSFKANVSYAVGRCLRSPAMQLAIISISSERNAWRWPASSPIDGCIN